jgi:ATP-dependent Clp protease ATP-binding subunit ClpX
MTKNKNDRDKEYLAEVLGWAERAYAACKAPRQPAELPAPGKSPPAQDFAALRAKLAAWRKAGARLPLEEDIRAKKFTDVEIQVIYLGLYCELIDRNTLQVAELMRKLCFINGVPSVDVLNLMQPSAPLLNSGVMRCSNNYPTGLVGCLELHPLALRRALGWRPQAAPKAAPLPPPADAKSIYAKLSETVVGQEEAKKRIASAAFRHLTAAKLNREREPLQRIQKANVLMIGPTGTGKTHMARALADILKVPFAACDATQYTESGYVGMNVEDMLVRLFTEAGKSHERMENGIIYIDEIDKIAAHDSSAGHNTTKDVSGLSVQQELLKLLDGDRVNYSRRGPMGETEFEFKVGGVLFVAGGAFQGLDEIVKRRLKNKAAIGFAGAAAAPAPGAEIPWHRQVTTEDLIEYGFIPEFIGRFAGIVTLDPLSEDDVLQILTKPRNSLASQYDTLLKEAGVNKVFTEEELRGVARQAHALNTGARGLKAIMEARVAPLLFEGGPGLPAKPAAEPGSEGGKAA